MIQKDQETGNIESNGRVALQIDVLPVEYAEKNKVGKAREEPNHSPNLPQPEGRVELSFNPLKMYQQLIGPEVRRKICIMLTCAVCWILFFATAPSLFGSLISDWITNLGKSKFD